MLRLRTYAQYGDRFEPNNRIFPARVEEIGEPIPGQPITAVLNGEEVPLGTVLGRKDEDGVTSLLLRGTAPQYEGREIVVICTPA